MQGFDRPPPPRPHLRRNAGSPASPSPPTSNPVLNHSELDRSGSNLFPLPECNGNQNLTTELKRKWAKMRESFSLNETGQIGNSVIPGPKIPEAPSTAPDSAPTNHPSAIKTSLCLEKTLGGRTALDPKNPGSGNWSSGLLRGPDPQSFEPGTRYPGRDIKTAANHLGWSYK